MASPLFFLFFLLSSIPSGAPDLVSDRAALLAFRSSVGRVVLRWNDSATPCTWLGVACDAGRVTVLRLPAVGLMGQIPAGTVGNLTALRTLSLRYNALSGGLPADLAKCSQLRNLYLQGNRFSGQIPAFLFSLQNLVRLNLAGNDFSGGISQELNNLTRLGTLYLESNRLSGEIPELNLPNLAQFNVSFNQLNGSIPSKLQKMPAEAFLKTGLCGGPLGPCPGEITPTPAPAVGGPAGVEGEAKHDKKKLSGGAIAGIAIGAAAGVLIILILVVLLCRKRSSGAGKTRSLEAVGGKPPEGAAAGRHKGAGDGENGNGAGSYTAAAAMAEAAGKKLVFFGTGARPFDLEDLLRASAEVLGKGTFGTVYKAVLDMGTTVAVKRLRDVNLPEEEFREKIEAIGSMDHPSLVPLRAYYYSKDEKLLVYDYLPMGSLSALLHGELHLLAFVSFITILLATYILLFWAKGSDLCLEMDNVDLFLNIIN